MTTEPLPCPNCGRSPKVKLLENAYSLEAIPVWRVECRRWFGLRSCFHTRLVALPDAARSREPAIDMWNRAVILEALCAE